MSCLFEEAFDEAQVLQEQVDEVHVEVGGG